MANNRRAGLISLAINGELLDVKDDVTYNLGSVKRNPIVGADRVHGFGEELQVPFIEGTLTDRRTLDLKALTNIEDATIVLETGTGKTVVFRNAWWAGAGDIATKEGAVSFRFEAQSAEEV